MSLSHLCFAEDLLIFSKGDVGLVYVIEQCISKFGKISGLVPNSGMSQVFLYGVSRVKDQIFSILEFPVGELPIRYLAVPLISSRL